MLPSTPGGPCWPAKVTAGWRRIPRIRVWWRCWRWCDVPPKRDRIFLWATILLDRDQAWRKWCNSRIIKVSNILKLFAGTWNAQWCLQHHSMYSKGHEISYASSWNKDRHPKRPRFPWNDETACHPPVKLWATQKYFESGRVLDCRAKRFNGQVCKGSVYDVPTLLLLGSYCLFPCLMCTFYFQYLLILYKNKCPEWRHIPCSFKSHTYI